MPSYQVTMSEGGAPNCAGVYEEHILYNWKMSYRCVNEDGTWYLWNLGVFSFWQWQISSALNVLGFAGPQGDSPIGAYTGSGVGYSGTATVAEYVAAQTLKQHLIVSRDGIIQPVGACVIVPGWV